MAFLKGWEKSCGHRESCMEEAGPRQGLIRFEETMERCRDLGEPNPKLGVWWEQMH